MDRGGFLPSSVKGWLGKVAESHTLSRADRAARRRAARGFTIPRGIGSTLALLFLAGLGTLGFVQGGHYERMRAEHGTIPNILARSFGFGVTHIGVSGNRELHREEVIALAGITPKASLPFLDPADVQARLAKVPLIADAAITKLYPDRLLITVTERVPFGLWQMDGKVQVIAQDGTPIEDLQDQRFLRLPHVVGKGANGRIRDYVRLVESVPELAGQIRAGTLVSERRWTLKLVNGVEIKLPEEAPEKALKAFAALERDAALSSRAILAVDLRIPDRVIVRLTEEAAAQHANHVAEKVKKMGGKV
jgi:cell division protein FtsQ